MLNKNNGYFLSQFAAKLRRYLSNKEITNKEARYTVYFLGLKFDYYDFKKGNCSFNTIIVPKYDVEELFGTKDNLERVAGAYGEAKRFLEGNKGNESNEIKYTNHDIDKINAEIDATNKKRFMDNINKRQRIESTEEDERDPDDMSDMENASEKLLHDDIYESEQLSDVEPEWKPKEGIFTGDNPRKIANYLLRNSKNKGQAMKRLVFYMNRAGENLKNKNVLNKAKELLKSNESLNEMNANELPVEIDWEYEEIGGGKSRAVCHFGKNGWGLSTEFIEIGKKIAELSNIYNVWIEKCNIDALDDVYDISFIIEPFEE